MWNKNYLYLVSVAVIIGISAVIFFYRENRTDEPVNQAETPTPMPSLTEQPTITPKPLSSTKPTPKPIPGISITEKNYDALTLQLDEDGNRRLVLNEDCTALVPSQVDYKNNVQIMLDNTYSSKPHILKIGGVEYSLAAGEWFMITLSRPNIPAKLPIFCGPMELGQLDLL